VGRMGIVGDANPEIARFRKEGMRSLGQTASRYPKGYPVLSESILP